MILSNDHQQFDQGKVFRHSVVLCFHLSQYLSDFVLFFYLLLTFSPMPKPKF